MQEPEEAEEVVCDAGLQYSTTITLKCTRPATGWACPHPVRIKKGSRAPLICKDLQQLAVDEEETFSWLCRHW